MIRTAPCGFDYGGKSVAAVFYDAVENAGQIRGGKGVDIAADTFPSGFDNPVTRTVCDVWDYGKISVPEQRQQDL